MQAYGAAVVACPTSEARWRPHAPGHRALRLVSRPAASSRRRSARIPWGVEGYKTIAYEIAEDLGWTAPDVVIVPSAYSDGLYGTWKGCDGAGRRSGSSRPPPRMIAAEPFGPLAHALERELEAPEMVGGAGAVGRLFHRLALRHLAGAGAPCASRAAPACALTDEGHVRGPAGARPRGRTVRRAVVGRRDRRRSCSWPRAKRSIRLRRSSIILTSGGLKDPGASRTWLPRVPAAGDDFDRLLTVLREAYGLALDR